MNFQNYTSFIDFATYNNVIATQVFKDVTSITVTNTIADKPLNLRIENVELDKNTFDTFYEMKNNAGYEVSKVFSPEV